MTYSSEFYNTKLQRNTKNMSLKMSEPMINSEIKPAVWPKISQDFGDKFYTTIPLSKVDERYAIFESKWENDKIVLRILLFQNATSPAKGYLGSVHYSTVRKTAMQFEKNFDDLLDEIKTAICTDNGLPNYSYTIDQENNFILKKEIENLKIMYLLCELELAADNLVADIFMESIRQQNQYLAEVQEKEAENMNIRIKMNEILDLQKKMAIEHEKYVENLLTKCRILINEKKARISQLEAAVLGGDDAQEFISSQRSSRKSYSQQLMVDDNKEMEIDEGHSDEKSSDDENVSIITLPKRAKIELDMPSTSKAKEPERNENDQIESDPFQKDTQAMLEEFQPQFNDGFI